MNRIPTEGLKRDNACRASCAGRGLNEQNPDRGIETSRSKSGACILSSLNEQNPDRGIETNLAELFNEILNLLE